MLTSWALGPLLFLVELLDFSRNTFRRNYIFGVITFSA